MRWLIQTVGLIFIGCLLSVVVWLGQTRQSVGIARIAFVTIDATFVGSWIEIMSLDGTDRQTLRRGQEVEFPFKVVWSANGKSVYVFVFSFFETTTLNIEQVYMNDTSHALLNEEFTLELFDFGNQETQIKDWIVFKADNNYASASIYIIPAEGGNARMISAEDASGVSFALAPNDKAIAYSQISDTEQGLYIQNLDDDPTPRQIVSEWAGYGLSWSPDGNWIYFFDYEDTTETLRRVQIDGTEVQTLNTATSLEDYTQSGLERDLQWSRDRRWVYWTRCYDTFTCELVKMRADGSEMRVTPFPPNRQFSQVQLAPDGEWFVLYGTEPTMDIMQIYIMREDGSKLRQLTHSANYHFQPVWSPPIDSVWHHNELIALSGLMLGIGVIARRRNSKTS